MTFTPTMAWISTMIGLIREDTVAHLTCLVVEGARKALASNIDRIILEVFSAITDKN